MEKPEKIYLYSNGNVSCYDAEDQQCGKFQKSWMSIWLEWMESQGVDPTKLDIQTMVNGSHKYVNPIKRPDGGWTWGFVDF